MQFLFFCIGSCPSDAAASLIEGTKCTSLGEVADGPRWENVTFVLKYINGDQCPDKNRKKTTILRLKCDENRIVSGFLLLGFYVFIKTGGLKSTCILHAEQFSRDRFVWSVSTNFVICNSFRSNAYILKMNLVQKC